ncbi:DUF3322 domain-containing protein [Castellaniella caeni]|uniref:DUF3322 domain-containing protein n=1 Tax=Castellaniella caeni TaxID=266123 RepID=UPI000C9F70D6|nr:DUF3322 domain-containing protein [Castellaniella caeni]
MWTTAKEARAQVQRLWDRGELLREACGAATHFPLRLSLKKPGSADITERFEAVRAWAAGLRNAPPLRIEWQPVRHRVQGEQQLPAALWLDALDDAVRWLDKQADWQRFADLVRMTRQRCPDVLPWVCKYPLQALALHPQWPALLQVVVWVRQHLSSDTRN